MLGTPWCVGAGSAHLSQATTSSCRNQSLVQAGARESGAGGTREKGKVQSSNKTPVGMGWSGQSLMIFLFWEGWEQVKFPVGKKWIPAFSRAECWKLRACRARLVSGNELTQRVQLTCGPTSWKHPDLQ